MIKLKVSPGMLLLGKSTKKYLLGLTKTLHTKQIPWQMGMQHYCTKCLLQDGQPFWQIRMHP